MEVRVLRYFLEIVRAGNMSRAAETLHVSQPTLSKQIKELEGELGKKLFHRGSTSLTLTEEGMLLQPPFFIKQREGIRGQRSHGMIRTVKQELCSACYGTELSDHKLIPVDRVVI